MISLKPIPLRADFPHLSKGITHIYVRDSLNRTRKIDFLLNKLEKILDQKLLFNREVYKQKNWQK